MAADRGRPHDARRRRPTLRARFSVVAVVAGSSDLTRVALRLGYSSHSHFTGTFRRAWSITPSRFRRSASSATSRRRRGSRRGPIRPSPRRCRTT
ncbi:MAG: helix-turn-helix domain-containing protein, partial [Gemmatimonadota bacterium]